MIFKFHYEYVYASIELNTKFENFQCNNCKQQVNFKLMGQFVFFHSFTLEV
jgi:hypothetical protein